MAQSFPQASNTCALPCYTFARMTDNIFGVTPETAPTPAETAPEASVSVPQDSGPAPEAEPAVEPAPSEPAKPEGSEDDDEKDLLSEDPNEGFAIGNKVYKDIGSADRAFRQFAGRAQAETRRRKEIEAELTRTHALLEVLKSERAERPQKQDDQGTPAPPPPPPQPKRLTDLVSDEEFDQLVAEHGPAKAFRRLAELTEDRLKEALEESQRDIKPILQQKQAAERTAQTFDHCAGLKDEAGNPLYPEIGDPNSPEAQKVFAIWQRNFQNPTRAPLAFTPDGIEFAILEYRSANGQPASRAPRTPAGAAVGARRVADRSLQSMGTGGASGARPGGPGPVQGGEERVQAAIRATQHPIFGVVQERRA